MALIFSQLWLLGISASAVRTLRLPCTAVGLTTPLIQVFSQSVPHLLAVFAMRLLSTGWSAYTIWRTTDLRDRLWHIIIAPNTPCHTDFDFLSGYFKSRLALQVSTTQYLGDHLSDAHI